ncbi:MAG TPA: bifunctional DNA primase/polymerase [Terriglobales bacterium]
MTPLDVPEECLCDSLVPTLAIQMERLAELGWRLFPCKLRDKTPLLKNWPGRATYEFHPIRSWRKKHPNCNWAVACGLASGLWVLDVDGSEGASAIDALCQQHGGDWLNTLTAVTARGKHLYFAYPTGNTIRNSAGKLGLGLDVRGDGGYVLVPPSVHPSGQTYRWIDSDVPVAAAPSWLCELAASAKQLPVPRAEIGVLLEGQRNDGLTRLAGARRRKGATQREIETELQAANMRRCKPLLPVDEVLKIASSIARYPVGGLDPLESAWEAVRKERQSRYELFLDLARELQAARQGQPIALPLKRIGALLECGFTLISRFRQRATKEGLLTLVARHVPHRKATLFTFNTGVEPGSVELNTVSSGLVTQSPASCPSYTHEENRPSCTLDDPMEKGVSLMIEGRI